MSKKDSLKIILAQKKPNKVYKVEVEFDHQIKELCSALRSNQDKQVSFVINGKHTKFNSLAGKKRFASGYEQGSNFVFGHAKNLFKDMQAELSGLKKELSRVKERVGAAEKKAVGVINKLRVNDIVKKLRQAAYADSSQELNEDRKLLKNRLDKIEPIINLVLNANTEGQLQQAYKLAKKIK